MKTQTKVPTLKDFGKPRHLTTQEKMYLLAPLTSCDPQLLKQECARYLQTFNSNNDNHER